MIALGVLGCGDNAIPTAQDPDDSTDPVDDRLLHVASPDWSDQVIYFILTDRFNDGDPSNNDQGADEYDPSRESHYSGGDLQGIIDQLDYIQDLGVTAVWITPPVANQWYDYAVNFGGYHGYWARHFKEVDEHYGTLETYKNLSHELHSRGMYLIQDVVVNHTGNFFYYQNNEYNPSDPTQNFVRNENSVPTTAPVQAPFDRNNALNPDHLADEIYHFTPTIRDQGNDFEVENYQLADLDDLNTENPVVREALRDSFAYWIAEVGVDGFRLDTAKYVSHDYWNDFIHRGEGDGTPGMNAVAASTGRDDFFSFGEVFNGSAPFDDSGEQKVTSYLGTPDTPEISAVLNFPLHFTLNDVFAGGAATARLGYRIEKHIDTSLFRDPQRTPMFIDNHDVSRFLSKGSVAGLKQALVLMFSLPGIPIIYQGTEQGLSITRPAMFEGGWNPNNDADGDNVADSALFDRDAELYQHIRALTEMRKANAILTRGETSVLISSQAGPGLFALQRSLDGQDAYILFNTADEPILLAEFATSLPKGGKLELLIGEGVSGDIVVGDNGAFTVELDPRAFAVLVTTGEVEKVDAPELSLTIDTKLNGGQFSEDITIFGTASVPSATFELVIDGFLADAIPVSADGAGNWTTTVPIARFGPGVRQHTVIAYARDQRVTSAVQTFASLLEFGAPVLTVADDIGDDHGPAGDYVYPTDSTYRRGQMDIENIEIAVAGSNLQITLTMGEISQVWGPIYGFDHASVTAYLDLPGGDGATVLPLANAVAPPSVSWDMASVIFGWGIALYSDEGATADAWGEPVSPVPEVAVSPAERTITMTYTTRALGRPATLSGTKIYITTWDLDGLSGTYRFLEPEAGAFSMGGGNYDTDPLIMDDTQVLVIP